MERNQRGISERKWRMKSISRIVRENREKISKRKYNIKVERKFNNKVIYKLRVQRKVVHS